jgi:SAM-dependent methyltransferase
MPEYISCNLCESNLKKLHYKINLNDILIDIVKCKECGLVYRYNELKGSEAEKLYSKDFFEKGYVDKNNQERLIKAGHRLLEEITKYHTRGKILDVGAGTGCYLKAAKEKGWEEFGVELSSYATEFAKKKFGLEIFNGKLEDAGFPDDFFDVVIMTHTIEHLPDPANFLKEIHRILKSDGIIYLSTPNFDSFNAKRFKEKWWALQPEYHLYFFSPKTLGAMLKKCNFKIIKIDTSNPIMTTGSLRKIGIPAGNLRRNFLNKYFSQPKQVIRYLVGKLIQGEIVVCYARKS